jgi:deazaflavin-dependent oxidoreductase (nitroreductase family)
MAIDQPTGRTSLTIRKDGSRKLFNSIVSMLLRSPLHAFMGIDRMMFVLRYRGRKSGQSYQLPLAYTQDGQALITFALFTNTVWWKNLRGGAAVQVLYKGRWYEARAETIEDVEAVADGWVRMIAAAPTNATGPYYQLPRTSDGQIDRPALLDLACSKVMIRISLQGENR